MISDQLKQVASEAIELEKPSLNFVSESLWNQPEVNYEEHHAHDLLSEYLENRGFRLERHYSHLSTAFRADFFAPGGVEGPTVCIICEYDALPELGHACGHNLIAEAGIAAALGVKAALEAKQDIKGKLVVMGTPAEEGGGGKIAMIKAGAFKDIDFAMMVHPCPRDILRGKTLAILTYSVRFLGREAHASAGPWEGINALDAAVSCYNDIALFRQQMKPTCKIHAIITKGGLKPNVIPGETEMLVTVRAPNMEELETMKSTAIRFFESAANSTGCRVSYQVEGNSNYESLLLNDSLLEIYGSYAEAEGVSFEEDERPASTDMGNVTRVVPGIQPYYAIPTKGGNHTVEFAEAAKAPGSQSPTLRAARCMAFTAIQIFIDPKLRESAKKEFNENKM